MCNYHSGTLGVYSYMILLHLNYTVQFISHNIIIHLLLKWEMMQNSYTNKIHLPKVHEDEVQTGLKMTKALKAIAVSALKFALKWLPIQVLIFRPGFTYHIATQGAEKNHFGWTLVSHITI